MQKARVITRSPENAGAIADQLRSYGYEVEIATPGGVGLPTVDLEVEIEFRGSTQALDRAAELAREDDADVYVAAGCFPQERSLPSAAVVIPVRPSIADTVNGVAAGLQNKRDLLAKALREQRALMREARIAQRQRREQEAARHAVQSVERARLQEQAEALRVAEEQKRIAAQQDEEAAMRRIAEAEQIERARALRRTERRLPDVLARTRRTHDGRIAFAIATAFAAVLTLGWSASTRTPMPPLSQRLVNGRPSVEQQTPFGAAIIKPPGVNPSKLNLPAAPTMKPSAALQEAPGASANLKRNTKHIRRKHSIQTHAAGRSQDVAEDQVRRVPPSQPAPAQPRTQSPQHASLKHYSDMN